MHPLRSIPLLAFALLLAACASGPNTRSDLRPGTNLASFSTYGYFSPLSTDAVGYSTLTTAHIKNAVDREMRRHGFTYSETNPDLLVNFQVTTRQTIQSSPSSASMTYTGWGPRGTHMGMTAGTPNVRTVDEGTLTIDLVERVPNQLVWRGAAYGRIPSNASSNPGGVIDNAVRAIFEQLPMNAR